ncbi:selenate reductase subunit YgfN [Escherichia coli]|uniref:Selenate reductase subunit YgfN n=1 Tax=Escherichia coli TaxID=562 RepID=A0A377DNP6_ECOLX|nr:selenate reductase subunit YgfN [Escherichia coli]
MDKGFADADVIIERTYNSTQAQQCPTETHICFTRMDGDRLVIHASTQVPWHLRRQVARLVGMKQHKVHVIKERVGGGFGSKQDILLEEVCAWATCVTGRPVLFRYTREEEFIANTSRHVAKVTVKLGAKKDGRLTAVKMDFRANTGPYGNHSLTVPCNGPALSLPLYPCDNVDFQVTTYYSNICPNGAYQGYGAPKGNFAITMALAELAEQLQIDQLEIIERNRVHEGQELKILGAIGEGKAPTSVPSAASCALEEILRQGREMIQWSSPKPQNGDWHIGRGVAIIMQKSGIPDIDQANCMIKLESDGTFIVHSGGADIGTGLDTVVTKLAAEVLHCHRRTCMLSPVIPIMRCLIKAHMPRPVLASRVTRRVWQRKIYGRKFCSTARKCWVSQWQMFNWQRRASCAARKAKLVSGILPIKAKPAPALVHWWELAVISRLISPSRMAQTSLKLPSTRVRVKSAWINSTPCWTAVHRSIQS